jgi:hypothetical protein
VVNRGESLTVRPGQQFRNITLATGSVLTIPHGTKLLCTGSATIDGTVNVTPGSLGGFIAFPRFLEIPSFYSLTVETPGTGSAPKPARSGEIVPANWGDARGSNTQERILGPSDLANLRPNVTTSGGGGAGALNNFGGSGGGSAGIYCHDSIVIGSTGSLSADAEPTPNGAGGGGAGGLLVLSSAGFISNAGRISANGGTGGFGSSNCAPGGGGGGGVVHLIARELDSGQILVDGGLRSTVLGNSLTPNSWKCGGAEGGTFGGAGGKGGDIVNLVKSFGSDGKTGKIYRTITTDPTALLL